MGNSKNKTVVYSPAELDALSWNILQECRLKYQRSWRKNGYDIFQLIDFFLWDKISRSLRLKYSPIHFEHEINIYQSYIENKISLLKKNIDEHNQKSYKPLNWKQRIKIKLRNGSSFNIFKILIPYSKSKQVFIPNPDKRLNVIVEQCRNIDGLEINSDMSYAIIPARIHLGIESLSNKIIQNLESLLKKHELKLWFNDIEYLRLQIKVQLIHLLQVERYLGQSHPLIVLVHTDNHYPYINYVLAARKLKIPTFMIQHGLDCEHNYLERLAAKNVFVWSNDRLNKYRKTQLNRKSKIKIIGNPAFDNYRLTHTMNLGGKYMLWISRPYAPHKCYQASRYTQEGEDILKSLLNLVAKYKFPLKVKLHPAESTRSHELLIQNYGLQDFVEISNVPVDLLIPEAKIVFADDSTTALEALILGKLLIHTNFTNSNPVLPIVKMKAGLSGYGANELFKSFELYISAKIDYEQINTNRIEFVNKYAGQLDGLSSHRCMQIIDQHIKKQ